MNSCDLQLKDVNGSEKSLNVHEVWDWDAPKTEWKRISLAMIVAMLGVEKLTAEHKAALTAAGGECVPHPFKIDGKKVRGWNMPPLRDASKSASICLPVDTAAESGAVEVVAEPASVLADGELQQETVQDALESPESDEGLKPELVEVEAGDAQRGDTEGEAEVDSDTPVLLAFTKAGFGVRPPHLQVCNDVLIKAMREIDPNSAAYKQGLCEAYGEARAEGWDVGKIPFWVELGMLIGNGFTPIFLYPDDGVRTAGDNGKPRAKEACERWRKRTLADAQADVDSFLSSPTYYRDYTKVGEDGTPNRNLNKYVGADGTVVTKCIFDKRLCNVGIKTGVEVKKGWTLCVPDIDVKAEKDGRKITAVKEGWKRYAPYIDVKAEKDVRKIIAFKKGWKLCVLDIDVKAEKDGRKVIAALEDLWGKLPTTMRVNTPTGGYHLYFITPDTYTIKSGADVFDEHGKGLDIRADGGYVVAPPSTINGVPYTYAESFPPVELPTAWVNGLVTAELHKHSSKSSSNGKSVPSVRGDAKPMDADVVTMLDQLIPNVKRAKGWLQVLSVCSAFIGGEELAREWSRKGEKYSDAEFDAAWAEVHSTFNRGVPMVVGTLDSICKANVEGFVNPAKVRSQLKAQEAQAQQNSSTFAHLDGNPTTPVNKALELASDQTELSRLPTAEVLKERIRADGEKAWAAYREGDKNLSNSGKWLAAGVVNADTETVKLYQAQHPTNSKGELRKMVVDGKVNWVIATYTAALHIGGVVLLMMNMPAGTRVAGLSKDAQAAVAKLVTDVLKASPLNDKWVDITDSKQNIGNTVTSAVSRSELHNGQGSKSSSNCNPVPQSVAEVAVDTGATPAFIMQGFGAKPKHLGGTAASGGGANYLSAGVGFAAVDVFPETPSWVGTQPVKPKAAKADKTPPLELLKAAMLADKKGVWYASKSEIYARNAGGWYEHVSADAAETLVAVVKEREGIAIGSMNVVRDTVRLLQKVLREVEFCTVSHLIPMKNGVLDTDTKELHPYSAMLPFNWHIPHDYTDSESCEVWKGFLAKQFGKDEGRTKTLKAFMRCMVGGAYQAQKYLEVVGAGGSGKSQLMSACIALMGEQNTITSSLNALDGLSGASRFETSNLYGKKLVVMPDQSKFFGESENFRKVTGNDHLRNEKKNVDAGSHFVYQGMVIITANQFMSPKNNGGAIMRRRVPVKMDVMASDTEKAQYPNGIGQHIIDTELAGVLNWILEMPLAEARAQLNNPDDYTKRLNNEVEDGNNPVRAWLRDEVVSCERGEETHIGNDIRDLMAITSPDWGMYASYCTYCRGAGNSPMNRKGFTDTVLSETRGKGVEYVKETKATNRNKWILSGLRLRKDTDD